MARNDRATIGTLSNLVLGSLLSACLTTPIQHEERSRAPRDPPVQLAIPPGLVALACQNLRDLEQQCGDPSIASPINLSSHCEAAMAAGSFGGTEPCRATHDTISASEWPALRMAIWNNPLFRNDFPGGYCDSRAALLSYLLDRMGYRSQQLIINGPMLPLYKRGDQYRGHTFSYHVVNVISLRTASGATARYVIDPMFTDDLVPLEIYTNNLSTSLSGLRTRSGLAGQTYESPDAYNEPLPANYDSSQETCSYNLNHLYRHARTIALESQNPESRTRKARLPGVLPVGS
jgi:hypothetical protein